MDFSKSCYNKIFRKNEFMKVLSKTRFNFHKQHKSSKPLTKYSMVSTEANTRVVSYNFLVNKMINSIKSIQNIKNNKTSNRKNLILLIDNFHSKSLDIKLKQNKRMEHLLKDKNIISPNISFFNSKNNNRNNIRTLYDSQFHDMFINNMVNNNYGSKNQHNINSLLFSKKKNFNKSAQDYQNFNTKHTSVEKSFHLNPIEKSISLIPKNEKFLRIKNLKHHLINPFINENKESEEKINSNKIINNKKLNNSNNNLDLFFTSLHFKFPSYFWAHSGDSNLQNFYSNTRNFRYKRYTQYIRQNKLLLTKEENEQYLSINEVELNRLTKLLKLYIPYFSSYQDYLIYLKDKIKIESEEVYKLKLMRSKLNDDFFIELKRLFEIHKKLKVYLNDKYFLLCVKNATPNINLFQENDREEFEGDLRSFEFLKKYVTELSGYGMGDSSILDNKKTGRRKSTIINNLKYFKMKFNASKIFSSSAEFYSAINEVSKRVEKLLVQGSKATNDILNLRDDYLFYEREEEQGRNKKIILNNRINYLSQQLQLIITINKKLNKNKNNLIQMKKKKSYIEVYQKIKFMKNNIINLNHEVSSMFIYSRNRNKPILILKDIENIINHLIDYKERKKIERKDDYNEIAKVIEKYNRIKVFKKRRREIEIQKQQKYRNILERYMEVKFIKNRKLDYKYSYLLSINVKKEEDVQPEEDSIDISY